VSAFENEGGRRFSDDDLAIQVVDVSKRFRLYREKASSLKQRITRWQSSVYEEFWALRDVSLSVPRGSAYGLIGHNGSGKSTLLRLMAGIHRPTTGTVTTDGRISALLELGAGFHPELSGRENVYLNGAILGLSRKELRTKIDEIVEFAGLEEFIDSPVKVYSSGMYVRLGFSVAVHVNPEILIVDEVIAVGDEEFQRRCFEHLYKLRRSGTTIVLVSHSLGLMQNMCDRAAWLDHGVVQAEGAVDEVVQHYLGKVNADERRRMETAGAPTEVVGHRGSGDIEVVDVEYLDGEGHSTKVGRSGDPFVIRIHYRAKQPVQRPVFGLAIHHESGAHITGPNTRYAGVDLPTLEGEGHVDHRFEALPLLPGTYRLSAAIVDWNLIHVHDFVDQGYTLIVQPGSNLEQHGYVSLGGTWDLETTERLRRHA
jgi:lipopolysaccharide transport system ATP-binding protein